MVDIIKLETCDNMYDIELDSTTNHRYYTNGILSHNSTTYTIFCLWYATLFADKKIMICANKLATAIEIMDRIRKAYEKHMCIVFNPSPFNEKIKQIDFGMLSYMILNEVEAQEISGCEIPEEALAFFKKRCIIMPGCSRTRTSQQALSVRVREQKPKDYLFAIANK